jgi:23S rRNA pseudouridine1911/1915/1917 synthase
VSETLHLLHVESGGERLDRFLSQAIPELSRTSLQRLITDGFVTVNARQEIRSALRLEGGDVVQVRIPPPAPINVEPEAIPLHVIFENEDVMVIDKPAGMVVHPALGHARGTLVGAVLAHAPEVEQVGEAERPGIVHRLDKDTSGLILVARNEAAQRALQRAFAEREVEKTYLALVDGRPPTPSGRVEAHIGRDPSHRQRMAVVPASRGRPAVTDFRTLETFAHHAWLEVHPLTGRTHQVRVHLSYIGCPLVGDRVYGRRTPSLGAARQMLHAARIRVTLPGEREARAFEAPLPEDMRATLAVIRST